MRLDTVPRFYAAIFFLLIIFSMTEEQVVSLWKANSFVVPVNTACLQCLTSISSPFFFGLFLSTRGNAVLVSISGGIFCFTTYHGTFFYPSTVAAFIIEWWKPTPLSFPIFSPRRI